jgi:hypothetical protein
MRDKVLIASKSNFPADFAALMRQYSAESGVVAVGAAAGGRAIALRDEGVDGLIIFDPARYDDTMATPERPLLLGEPTLFGTPGLRDYADALSGDLDAVLSPTGQIAVRDDETLNAVIAACNAADHPKVITTLPVHEGWLSRVYRETLIRAIAASRRPVAIIAVGQRPLEVPELVEGLSYVCARVSPIVHRTDMSAVQVIPRGALAAAVGATPSLRHVIPVGELARRRKRKKKGAEPSMPVFVPGIDEFRDVRTLEDWFGDDAPRCALPGCCGWRLTDFTADTRTELAGHNAEHVLVVAGQMLEYAPGDRMQWLRDYRGELLAAFEQLRLTTGRRDIKPYGSCAVWNSLDD